MKLAEIASMSEDAFNLVMEDLTPLFRRAVDANCAAKQSRELLIQDPDQLTMKGCPWENRIKSGVEKKSKRSKKNLDKASVDTPVQNERRGSTSKRQTSHIIVELLETVIEPIVPSSDPFLDEFDAYVCSQLTQDRI